MPQVGVRDLTGRLLTTPQNQLTRWQEYFKDNFAIPPQQISMSTTQMTPESTKIPTKAPTINEIKMAIKHLKQNKASGPDNLPAEFFRNHPNTTVNILAPSLKKVWNSGQIPNEWKQGLIIKLHKKGDLTECSNWRGITLLNTIGKILAIIIIYKGRSVENRISCIKNRVYDRCHCVQGMQRR
jgi:hypothetical protein